MARPDNPYQFSFDRKTGHASVKYWRGWIRGEWILLSENDFGLKEDARIWAETIIRDHASRRPTDVEVHFYRPDGTPAKSVA